MKPLLIEIGSEEIPARFISVGLSLLKEGLVRLLETSSISYGAILEYATPRRLALLVDGVAGQQDDRTTETLGPPKKAAYDADGNPTKAATGFARSLNIDVKDLTIMKTERGEYVSATIKEKGRPSAQVLSEELPKLISSLHLPKSMKWGNSDLRYFRPIQWILALLGDEVISFELDTIRAGNISYGHRFLSPAPVTISDPFSYLHSLKQNCVLADPAERKDAIRHGIRQIESIAGCSIHRDDDLLETVTNLVEHPTAVLGRFDDKYLALPKELLITVMKAHQKYFSMEDRDGSMKSSFIVISNMNSAVNDTVSRGAERVLRARLEDARFYFIQDRKTPLWDNVEKLKKVTFQEKLGNLYEKVTRISLISTFLAEQLDPELMKNVQRASMLCKADLVTGVVGEFPELQGYIGMIYAEGSNEDHDVASAIYEHYLPRFSGDKLPSGKIGTLVSLADKMDNIASFFYLGLIPTGSEDPFALRRQAAGIIHILQDIASPFPLDLLIDNALKNLEPSDEKRAEPAAGILRFFIQRLEGILAARGHSHDIINAALAKTGLNIADINQRIQSLESLKKEEGFPALLTAAKRVYNILSGVRPGDVKEDLLSEPSEIELFNVAGSVMDGLSPADFQGLFRLEKPVNSFFEKVLVMDKDPLIRENRLKLLMSVRNVFDTLGDFSKLEE